MPDTNQSQNSMEADAQSGKTRVGAPDGPRQNRGKADRCEPLEFPGHETVAQFMATPKSLREFESVTALAKHFNITTKTIYCWMKDDDVMRRADCSRCAIKDTAICPFAVGMGRSSRS